MKGTVDDEPVTLIRQSFAVRHLRRLRQIVAWAARLVGLDNEREQSLVLAVSEAAGNAVKHGGGTGELELIRDDNRALIAEISDAGPGMPPNVPIALSAADHHSGRGLYLMQESCDHVEYRTGPDGTTVHLEMKLDNG